MDERKGKATGIERKHPSQAEGYVRVQPGPQSVHVSCQWPLDVDTGEWFRFDMEASSSDFEKCIDSLKDSGIGVIHSDDDKQCSFIARQGGLTAIEMISGKGPFRKALYLDNVGAISDLSE